MAKRGKLKTRKSTLGATREQRIASAVESLTSSTLYSSSKDRHRKYISSSVSSYGRSPIPMIRKGYHVIEQRKERTIVPTEIDMHPYVFGNQPAFAKATSCSITTRSSLRRHQPPQSPGVAGRPRVQSRPMSSPAKKSMVASLSNSVGSEEGCEERVEILSMKNKEDRTFVRILASKTSPNAEIKASASMEEKPNRLTHNNNEQHRDSSIKSAASKSMPPILKTMETIQLGLCSNRGASMEDIKKCTIPLIPSCPVAMTSLQKQLHREKTSHRRIDERGKPWQKTSVSNSKPKYERAMSVPVPQTMEQQSFRVAQEKEEPRQISNVLYNHRNHATTKDPPRRYYSFHRETSTADSIKLAKKEQKNQAKKEQEKQTKREGKKNKLFKRIGAKLAKNKQAESLGRSYSLNSSSQKKIVNVPSYFIDDNHYKENNKRNSISQNIGSRYVYGDDDHYEDDDDSTSSNAASHSFESYDDGVIRVRGTLLTNSGKKIYQDKIQQIPQNVSFVSSTDAGDLEHIDYRDDAETHNTWTIQHERGEPSILGALGNAFGFGEDQRSHYIQDLRNLDSDISSSGDERDY